MTGDDIKFLLFIGIPSLWALTSGRAVFKKELSRQNKSNYYMDVNLFLTGVIGTPLFVVLLIFHYLNFKYPGVFNKKTFYCIAISWASIMVLIPGLHGIVYRKKINNRSYFQICTSQFLCGIFGIIGVIAYGFLWGWK